MGRALRFLSSALIALSLPALARAQLTTMKTVTDTACASEACTATSPAQWCIESAKPSLLYHCNPSTGVYEAIAGNVRVAEVCPGCRYTQMCNATCSSATSDCVAGTAIYEITHASPPSSTTNPWLMVTYPGSYPECVAFNNVTDVTWLRVGNPRIVPAVTTHQSVDGGVVRIGNSTSTPVQRLTIEGEAYVRNDSFSSPESAIQIGAEGCAGASTWDWITIIGGTWIGNHDGVQWCGITTSGNSVTGLPHLFVKGATSIGGADNVVYKGAGDITYQDATIRTITNYCETKEKNCVGGSNPGTACPIGNECTGGGTCTPITNQRTGSVASTGTTTTFTLASTESNTNHIWGGRHVRLTAGTCNNGGAGHDCWIQDSDTNRLVTLQAACTPSVTPDNTCTYTIDAVANASEQSDCGGMDWTQIRAQAGSTSWWKTSGFHAGVTGPGTAPDLDILRLTHLNIDVQNNDWGPATSTGQAYVAGILFPTGIVNHQNVIMDGINIRAALNTRLPTSATNAHRFGGVVFSDGDVEGPAQLMNTTIVTENTGDPNAPNYGVVAKGTTAVDLRVDGSHIETHNTVGSYVGTTATLLQASPGILRPGTITSDAPITTIGTMTPLNSMSSAASRSCFQAYLTNLANTDEFVIELPPISGTMTRFDCETFAGTSFDVNVCDGEDLGDDTCTTSILGAALTCGTSGANDTTLSATGFLARDKVSIVISNVTGGPPVNGMIYMTCTGD